MSLGVSEAVEISKFVIDSQALKTLVLYDNKFGVEGAKALGEALRQNSVLEELDLGCNRIRNKGARAIAQGIMGENSNSKLRVLGLKNNFINEKGFKTFVELFQHSFSHHDEQQM